MAGIDRTNAKSWEEYRQLRTWIRDNDKSFQYKWARGRMVRVSDCLYRGIKKKCFDGNPVPVMITPSVVDVYLVCNCPLEFVQLEMKNAYGENWYNYVKEHGTQPPKEMSND